MFRSCGRFRFGVRIIYGTAVFIKSVFKRLLASPIYCKKDRFNGLLET